MGARKTYIAKGGEIGWLFPPGGGKYKRGLLLNELKKSKFSY